MIPVIIMAVLLYVNMLLHYKNVSFVQRSALKQDFIEDHNNKSAQFPVKSSFLESIIHTPIANGSKTERYFIYYCGERSICGGFADRQKGIVMAYFIAKLTNRKFRIKIVSPNCSYQRYFNMPDYIYHVRLKNPKDREYSWIDSATSLEKVRHINFSDYFKEDVVYFRTNLDYWNDLRQNELYKNKLGSNFKITNDKMFAHVIPEIFKLNDKVMLKLLSFMEKAKPTPSSKLICANVRTGRNPSNPKDSVTRATADDIEKVWNFLRRYNNQTLHKIFVSTDSENVRQNASILFKTQIVEMEGSIMHSEKDFGRQDICDGLKKVILDQQIMMRCDVLLISKSGLARIAAYVRAEDTGLFCLFTGKNIKPCKPSEIRSLYNVLG